MLSVIIVVLLLCGLCYYSFWSKYNDPLGLEGMANMPTVYYGPNGDTLHVENTENDRTITVLHSSGMSDIFHASTTVSPNIYTGLNNTSATISDDYTSVTVVRSDGSSVVFTAEQTSATISSGSGSVSASTSKKSVTATSATATGATATATTSKVSPIIKDDKGNTVSTYSHMSKKGIGTGGNGESISAKIGGFIRRHRKHKSRCSEPTNYANNDLYVLKTSIVPMVPAASPPSSSPPSSSPPSSSLPSADSSSALDMFDASTSPAPPGYIPIHLTRSYNI